MSSILRTYVYAPVRISLSPSPLDDFQLILVLSHQRNFLNEAVDERTEQREGNLKLFSCHLVVLRTGLLFTDILPENAKSYDKMRPPKKDGAATTVFFHVTVMGLDSIDETSMVSLQSSSRELSNL